jgi:hypothetical protein
LCSRWNHFLKHLVINRKPAEGNNSAGREAQADDEEARVEINSDNFNFFEMGEGINLAQENQTEGHWGSTIPLQNIGSTTTQL